MNDNQTIPTQKEMDAHFGYVYEVECSLTGFKYIGKHKHTVGEEWRSYMGSGQALKADQKFFGIKYFTKSLVEWADSDHDLTMKESRAIERLVNSGMQHYNFSSEDGYLFGLSAEAERMMTVHRLSYRPLKGLRGQRSMLVNQILDDPDNAIVYRKQVQLFSDALDLFYLRVELKRAMGEAEERRRKAKAKTSIELPVVRRPRRSRTSTPFVRSLELADRRLR